MTRIPKKVRYDLTHRLVCEEHFEHGPLDCCPFLGCPNGTDSDQIVAGAPYCEPEVYSRAVWTDAEGEKLYSWVGPLPLWFSIRRVMWREAIRKGIVKGFRQDTSTISTIYHYTSPQGLLGIIDSGELWLSDYRYLNDNSELIHGLNLTKSRFELAANKTSAKNILLTWANTIKTSKSRVCIASFSSNGDSLSQWRAYGPVAIGFNSRSLNFGYANSVIQNPVIYDHETQVRFLDLMAHLVASAYAEDVKSDPIRTEKMYEDGSDFVLQVAALFKHHSFSDEREFRMAYIENPRIFGSLSSPLAPYHFRASSDTIIPYVTTRDIAENYPERLQIEEIVVGPGRNSEVLQRGIVELLAKRGYYNVPVRRSETPFRL